MHTIAQIIVSWLLAQLEKSGQKGFVVGVSGGVDSGLVSKLCAMTGKPTMLVNISMNYKVEGRASRHMAALGAEYENVSQMGGDIADAFVAMEEAFGPFTELAQANLQSRLRMCALYTFANNLGYLVVGTGNKVEDYGIGFFTKYGDGGVDISPIGDLTKTQVRGLAKHICVLDEIVNAVPTDGLWEDGRSDETQIGATYAELEMAMEAYEGKRSIADVPTRVMDIFLKRHAANAHKMEMPPVCNVF